MVGANVNTKDKAVDNGCNDGTICLTRSFNNINDVCSEYGNYIRCKGSTTGSSEESSDSSILERFGVRVVECIGQGVTVWVYIELVEIISDSNESGHRK